MKTKLLLLALMVTAFGYSQDIDGIPTGSGFYINKIMASPSGDDLTKELLEVRGPANTVVPTNLYFITIEGDGDKHAGSLGSVQEAVQLGDGTRTFGDNGILVLISNYTQDSGGSTSLENLDGYYDSFFEGYIHGDATVIEISLGGGDLGSSSSSAVTSISPDIGCDGNFIDQTGTYMLITADSDPDGDRIDGTGNSDADGIIDASADPLTNNWVLYDSVAYMDDNDEGQGEYAWAQIIFAQDNDTPATAAVQYTTTSANVYSFSASSDANIMMRQGSRTGYTTTDWVASATSNNDNPPDWTFSSTTGKTIPVEFEGWADLNTVYGQLNPALTLSIDDNIASKFRVYPNPAKNFLTIEAGNVEITSVSVFNILGAKVLEQNELAENRLNVSTLSKGVYLLEITGNNSVVTKKFIVE